MKQRVIFRFWALLLCAVLLLPFFPAGSIAEAQRAEEGKVTILSEIESERTAFEKHYLLSNGSYCAVSYPEAVHEQDESGRWVDVDNTPVYSAASAAHKVTGKTYGATFDSKSGNATLSEIVSYVNRDAEEMGFTFIPVEKNQVIAGTYKVALVIDTADNIVTPNDDERDYHWYRQNPDGTWSHKPGGGAVRNCDGDGNSDGAIIYDPEYADRSYFGGVYETFVGFFAVTPIR